MFILVLCTLYSGLDIGAGCNKSRCVGPNNNKPNIRLGFACPRAPTAGAIDATNIWIIIIILLVMLNLSYYHPKSIVYTHNSQIYIYYICLYTFSVDRTLSVLLCFINAQHCALEQCSANFLRYICQVNLRGGLKENNNNFYLMTLWTRLGAILCIVRTHLL